MMAHLLGEELQIVRNALEDAVTDELANARWAEAMGRPSVAQTCRETAARYEALRVRLWVSYP